MTNPRSGPPNVVKKRRRFAPPPDQTISEGHLFGPYGDVRQLHIGGVLRGSHRLYVTPPHPGGIYEALVTIVGDLPATVVRPRRTLVRDDAFFGVTKRTGIDAIDDAFRVMSRGLGFGAALLVTAWDQLSPVRGLIDEIVIRPSDVAGVSALRVRANVDGAEHIDAVIAATVALVGTCDGMIADGEVFESSHLSVEAAPTAPPEERIEAMLTSVAASCEWLGAVPEHVGTTIMGRLHLEALALDLRGTLKVAFVDAGATSVDVVFEGALPTTTTATVVARPQGKGLRAALGRIGEATVDDAAIDDAFVLRIEGNAREGRADLFNARYELLDLKDAIEVIEIAPAAVSVTCKRQAASAGQVSAQVAVMLELWRELATARSGVTEPG